MICLFPIVHLLCFIMCDLWICVFVYFFICAFVIFADRFPSIICGIASAARVANNRNDQGWQPGQPGGQPGQPGQVQLKIHQKAKGPPLEKRSAPPPKSIIANSRRLSASCYSVNFTALVVVLMQTILNFFLKCLKLLLLEIADNTFDCTSFVTADQHQAQQKETNFSDKYGSGQIQYLYIILYLCLSTPLWCHHIQIWQGTNTILQCICICICICHSSTPLRWWEQGDFSDKSSRRPFEGSKNQCDGPAQTLIWLCLNDQLLLQIQLQQHAIPMINDHAFDILK